MNLKNIILSLNALFISSISQAGGFSLYTESSVVALGNYGAGVAAEAADASIGWYNPAGLVLIKKPQLILGGIGVFPSTKLSGNSTYSTPNPLGGDAYIYTQTFKNLQASESALLPSLHYALPLGERAGFGLSIVSPFGLSTNYNNDAPVRYAATLSKVETINISPELGGKLNDNFAIGLGLDLQYARVNFNRIIGTPAFLQAFAEASPETQVYPNSLDSSSNNSGNSFGIGFHAGLMLMTNDKHARLGLNYQSQISHKFDGSSQLTGRLADPSLSIWEPVFANPQAQFTSDTLYSNPINFPNIITLSSYNDINAKWALLSSIVYAGWGTFKAITLNNVAVGSPLSDGSGNILTNTNSTSIEDYRDTWRFALGLNYKLNKQWLLRCGGGYDQTPTVNTGRDVRLPDADRLALSIGAHYQATPKLGFDVGYTSLFALNDSLINNTQAIKSSTYNVNATSHDSAQLIGAQIVWSID